MQSMPAGWQARAVAVFDELTAAYAHLEHPAAYIVTPATECAYSDLNEEDMAELGITQPVVDDENSYGDVYYDKDGNVHSPDDRLLVPTGADDPIPHYDRGRTVISPQLGT